MLFSIRSFSLVLFLIIVFSCDYQTDDLYYKEIPKPDFTDVTIELSGDSNDTLYLYQRTVLSFSGMTGVHKVVSVNAKLGTTQLGVDLSQGLVIDANVFETGIYPLKIELHLTGGNGSYAEFREEEEGIVSLNYVVVIDKTPPPPIHITSAENVEGLLEINWEPYSRFNFQYFKLSKYCYNSYYDAYEYCWIREFGQEVTSFSDSSFVGGKAKYVLTLGAANVESTDEIVIDSPYDPAIEFKFINENTVELKWRKPPFYKSLSYYQLYFPDESNEPRTFETYQPDDTTLTIDPQIFFPEMKLVRVVANPKMDNGFSSCLKYSDTTLLAGDYFPLVKSGSLVYHPKRDKYFAIGYYEGRQSLVQINTVTYEIEQHYDSDQGLFAISDDGNLMYVVNNNKLIKLDPDNFSMLSAVSFTPTNYYSEPRMRVSDTDRLIWDLDVWDLKTTSVLQKFASGVTSISSDGKYIFGAGKLYRFNGSTYENVPLPATGFRGDLVGSTKLLVYKYGQGIDVFDLNTMSLENTISSSAHQFSYDPGTGMIGGFADQSSDKPIKFYQYSVLQSTPFKIVDNIGSTDTNYSVLTLAKNKIICSCGQIVPVEWYK